MEWAQNKGSRSARSALKAVSRGRNAVKIYGLFFESVRHGPQAACTELCICETAPDVSCQRRRGLCIVSSLFGGRCSGSYIRRVPMPMAVIVVGTMETRVGRLLMLVRVIAIRMRTLVVLPYVLEARGRADLGVHADVYG